eukprot:CAMPEP_0202485696 /NCGR_PEP_ID=MMETSP1361-20130828/4479_1 /ASSEMBLY_ACC=CAM_ASM_000849 /TAXON_ID=210615 /ORGANISM="Staurosira complex sp., Strain CCMP2646" /LENGTH=95 /DNA_ID=CAMNT_0049114663 /DNA_START=157 /DNA_END=445 /DNA_ORIENTATION=+
MDFLFSPELPLFDLLQSFDLLKMLHLTTAAAGRATVPKLKAFQQAPQMVGQSIIYVCTLAVFDSLNDSFDYFVEMVDEEVDYEEEFEAGLTAVNE